MMNDNDLAVLLRDARAQARRAALDEAAQKVRNTPLYDENDRIVTMAGDTRELRTLADAAEAFRQRAATAVEALQEPTDA